MLLFLARTLFRVVVALGTYFVSRREASVGYWPRIDEQVRPISSSEASESSRVAASAERRPKYVKDDPCRPMPTTSEDEPKSPLLSRRIGARLLDTNEDAGRSTVGERLLEMGLYAVTE